MVVKLVYFVLGFKIEFNFNNLCSLVIFNSIIFWWNSKFKQFWVSQLFWKYNSKSKVKHQPEITRKPKPQKNNPHMPLGLPKPYHLLWYHCYQEQQQQKKSTNVLPTLGDNSFIPRRQTFPGISQLKRPSGGNVYEIQTGTRSVQ